MCKKIADGDCTALVRKTRPNRETPFKCYLYCTNGPGTLFTAYDGLHYNTDSIGKSDLACINGKIIGEFVCDKIYLVDNQGGRFVAANEPESVTNDLARQSCLTYNDMANYLGNRDGYAWHISNLVIYDKPKSLEMYPTGKIARDCGCGGYIVYDKILTRPLRGWCYTRDKEN